MDNKLILLFLFIILIVIVIYFIYNQKLSKSVSNLKIFKNKLFESFTNSSDENLLTNGSFSNGQNITEFTGSNGINNIITMNNPSDGDYVLKQKQSGELTYYKITIDTESNKEYNLTFWVRFKNLTSQNMDFNNLIKVNTQDDNSINNILSVQYKINKKLILSNNNVWYNVSYTFTTPTTSTNSLNIYLNYTKQLQATQIYFTDLSVYQVLSSLPSYTLINNLKVFLSGEEYSTSTINKKWMNLVDDDTYFTWSNIPISSETEGYLSTLNNSLSFSQPKTVLENNGVVQFSIGLVFNRNMNNMSIQENSISEENQILSETGGLNNVLSISGNNGKSIQLYLPSNEGKIKVVYDDSEQYTAYSSRDLVFYNKTVLVLTYQNNTINVYQDSVPVLSLTTGTVYLDNNNLVINTNGDWDVNLYNIVIYNSVLSYEQLQQINTYFFNKKVGSEGTFVSNGEDVQTYNGEFESEMDNTVLCSFGEQLSDSNYGNCLEDCNNLCSKFIDTSNLNGMEKFNKCRRSCKNTVKSCQTLCTNNPNNRICQINNCGSLDSSELCPIDIIQSECPKVYKKNGQYTVYIQSDTPYATELGFSGEKSYGYNRENAAAMYKQNFPNCDTPDILKVGEGRNLKEGCPFVIKENNPCYSSHCKDIDWECKDSINKMSQECKFNVSSYCEINKNLDNACSCWKQENRHKQKCVEFRKQFQNPKDYMCNISDFNIKEHPDFKKYIRKDSIPCWGCNIPN